MSRMPSLESLFEEQQRLHVDECRIRHRLTEINQQIHYLLSRHAHANVVGGIPATVIGGRKARPSVIKRDAGRRQWFGRGETSRLIQRVTNGSMRPAQVVHAVMREKGYAETLGVADKKKAEAALHQAVINAVKTNLLILLCH